MRDSVERLPVPVMFRNLLKRLDAPTQQIHDALHPFRDNETSPACCWVPLGMNGLRDAAARRFAKYEQKVLCALEIFRQTDALVQEAYCLSDAERQDLKSYLGRPLPDSENIEHHHTAQIAGLFTGQAADEDQETPGSDDFLSRASTKY